MSTDTAYSAVKAQFLANWTTTPILWENELVDPPVAEPWVFVEFIGDLTDQESIGAGTVTDNLWRENGVILAHVHVPSGSGALLARQYARQIADLFRGVELVDGAMRFERFSFGAGETGDENGAWWRLPLTISYQLDT